MNLRFDLMEKQNSVELGVNKMQSISVLSSPQAPKSSGNAYMSLMGAWGMFLVSLLI